MQTNKPISGKVFHGNDQNKLIETSINNEFLHVDIDFVSDPTQNNPYVIEFLLFKDNPVRLLSSVETNPRKLQEESQIKLMISNQPISQSGATQPASAASLTSLQYFLYIGVPIISVLVLGLIALALALIVKKMKQKRQLKISKKTRSSVDLEEISKVEKEKSTVKNQMEESNVRQNIEKSQINNINSSSMNNHQGLPIVYVLPQGQGHPPQISQIHAPKQMPFLVSSGIQHVHPAPSPLPFINTSNINSPYPMKSSMNINQIQTNSSGGSHNVYSVATNVSNFRTNDRQTNPAQLVSAFEYGPILRSNSIRPVRASGEEDRFVFPVSEQPEQINSFSNNLRIDDGVNLPSEKEVGEVSLFEVQLNDVIYYNAGTKFS